MASVGLIRIAARNLRKNLRRTLITSAAIATGLALLIFTNNLQTGSYDTMVTRGVSMLAGHVVVQAEGYQDDPDMHRLVPEATAVSEAVQQAVPGARVASRVLIQGLIQSTRNTSGVALVGIEPEVETTISDWQDKLVEGGSWLETDDQRGVLLGEKLAESLEAELGDKVVLMVQGKDEVVSRLFRIRGLIRTGTDDIDGFMGIVTVDAARAALEQPDTATMVTIHLADATRVSEVHATVQQTMGERPVEVLPWQEALPELYEFIQLDRQSARVMFFIIAIIVCMGVLNTVLMSVMERVREFGVMMALGTRPGQVFRIILFEGILLGIFATFLGLLLGLALTWPFYVYGIDFSELMGGDADVAGIPIDAVIFPQFNWPGMAVACAIALCMTVLSTLWPAWYAARLEPVQAMRQT
jgi:ABC-type lipoprotein release transport system permease subunit